LGNDCFRSTSQPNLYVLAIFLIDLLILSRDRRSIGPQGRHTTNQALIKADFVCGACPAFMQSQNRSVKKPAACRYLAGSAVFWGKAVVLLISELH
jgi:hypothetical protein